MSWFSHELICTTQRRINGVPQQKKSTGSAYETTIYDQCADR